MRILPFVAGWLVLAPILTFGDDAGDDRFETKIRPILAEHCWKCHGPDKQSSDLRLDSREAMLRGGDIEGAAVMVGRPDASPLIRAIRHEGDLKMPPKSRLPDAVVADLSDWIKAGAAWPKSSPAIVARPQKRHWSFEAVRKPIPPAGSISPIDAFIAARLPSGLATASRADRATLIRRATFDLTGLPPTPEDVDAFLADPDPDREAFAEVVDRLLASPHYGERWGRLWLDVARYADTKGYVFNEDRNYAFAYTYRDWVVSAMNRDLPYDQFVVKQIAADSLPHDGDNADLAAMGFLTVGRRFLQDANEIIDDRIDVVTRGLLGLSVSCARCHDHKFDPIPTDDYYSLYGVFASSEEPADLPILGHSDGTKASQDYQKKLAERRTALDSFLSGKRSELQGDLRGKLAAYLVAADSLDFDPKSPRFDEAVRTASLRPELLRRLMVRWKDRLAANDPRLTPWKAYASIPAGDFSRLSAATAAAIRGAHDPNSAAPAALIEAVLRTPPASRRELVERYGEVLAAAAADSPEPKLVDLRRWLDSPESPIAIAPADLKRLLNKVERNRLRDLEKKVSELDTAHPGAPARAMVMVDKAKPVDPHVFIRGNPGRPGKQVPRRFLKAFSAADRPAFKGGSGRLELARAIVEPTNPLTARVMVNRIWMNHFGQGLVRTPSDFGLRGDPPTHPELLDWLAATFVERGWSVKSMHRLIMNSEVYQRRSDASPEAIRLDPQNLTLSHQNRRRLDFETMRDALLSASGHLDPAIGGRSVPLETPPFPTRRTMYGTIDRYNLDPVFRTFDFPNPDTSSPRRLATIVPQQALYLLNSPFAAEQARRLAERPEVASAPPEARVRQVYRILFARDPEPREVEVGLRFVSRQGGRKDDSPLSTWSYGTGRVVESAGGSHVEFHPLPHWTGQSWQVGPKLPTPEGSYASLTNVGGHPVPDGKTATVIRWMAPADLSVTIQGKLGHEAKEGDGVRARLVSDRTGVKGTWLAHTAKVTTAVDRFEVKKGEILDFVVDCRAEHSFDGYTWAPSIRLAAPPSTGRSSWDFKAEFHGPESPPLTPWEAYAQALLLTNEFLYID